MMIIICLTLNISKSIVATQRTRKLSLDTTVFSHNRKEALFCMTFCMCSLNPYTKIVSAEEKQNSNAA